MAITNQRRIEMLDGKWFTIYHGNGTKSYVYGWNKKAACKNGGLNSDDPAIAWIDENGITATHYYNKKEKMWKEYKTMKMSKEEFKVLTLDDILNKMDTHDTIIVVLQNKNQFMLKRDWSFFSINQNNLGWIEYIEISFAEYCKGSYWEDGEEKCHYMCCGGQFFSPVDLPHALVVLKERVEGELSQPVESRYSTSIEEICRRQEMLFEG